MSWRYLAFGLMVEADRPIPGLAPSQHREAPDLRIETRSPGPLPRADDWQDLYVSSTAGENGLPLVRVSKLSDGRLFRYLYDDGAEFRISGEGRRIWAGWPETLTIDDVAPYLTGPIFGFALRLRGVTSLHASAIAVDDRALAFVGPAGAGKSTTAAAFARLDYPVLTDDIVTVSEGSGGFLVHPGYPWIRLWPDSVEKLFGSKEALPRISPDDPTWDKRFLDLSQESFRFAASSLPLGAVYLLGDPSEDDTRPRVERPAAPGKLLSMVGNTYSNYVLDKEVRAREFELLGRLARSVPVRLVLPHSRDHRLTRLCDAVLWDYAELSREAPKAPVI